MVSGTEELFLARAPAARVLHGELEVTLTVFVYIVNRPVPLSRFAYLSGA